jgi:signal transduction histidine kinase
MLGRGTAAVCAAFDAMGDALGVLWPIRDASGRVVDFEVGFVNPEGDVMMGISMDDERGTRVLEVMPAIVELGIFDRLVRVAETGEANTEVIEFRGLWRGAVQMSGLYIHSILPFGEGVLSLSHDITEERRREAELRDFAAVAAHDLRDPLIGVNMVLDLLVRRVGDLGVEEQQMVDMVRTGVGRSLAWVDGTLDYATAAGGIDSHDLVDCAVVTQEVVEALGPQIEHLHATVTVGAMPTVRGHHDALASVFQNLLSNALKFRSEELPVVDISSSHCPDGWEFTVTDNGVGLGDASGIFEMFRRSGEQEGRGIGLAVCRRVIERHDGRIWAGRVDTGGSAFHFLLPDR